MEKHRMKLSEVGRFQRQINKGYNEEEIKQTTIKKNRIRRIVKEEEIEGRMEKVTFPINPFVVLLSCRVRKYKKPCLTWKLNSLSRVAQMDQKFGAQ